MSIPFYLFLARSIFVNWICDQPAGRQTKQSATGRHCGERSDEAIRDGSSLRGAQRRSNPGIHDLPDCFVATLLTMTLFVNNTLRGDFS
jgi:hypothetical protein